jgi:CRP/FNR family transcriptional regulator, cyclic AMP receptor protein
VISEALEHALALVRVLLTTPEGIVALASAFAASAFNIAGTFVKTMIPLRWLAAGGNLGFMLCGALFPSLPMLILHTLLLPINSIRAIQMMRLTRRVNRAGGDTTNAGLWLRPYMTRRKLEAGEILFNKGDAADHLYMLAEGKIEVVEIGTVLTPGGIFGEIAFFAPDKRRTMTARCVEPCLLLSIDEPGLRQLYYQNPEFGFQLIGLVAARMHADVERLRAQVDIARQLPSW